MISVGSNWMCTRRVAVCGPTHARAYPCRCKHVPAEKKKRSILKMYRSASFCSVSDCYERSLCCFAFAFCATRMVLPQSRASKMPFNFGTAFFNSHIQNKAKAQIYLSLAASVIRSACPGDARAGNWSRCSAARDPTIVVILEIQASHLPISIHSTLLIYYPESVYLLSSHWLCKINRFQFNSNRTGSQP